MGLFGTSAWEDLSDIYNEAQEKIEHLEKKLKNIQRKKIFHKCMPTFIGWYKGGKVEPLEWCEPVPFLNREGFADRSVARIGKLMFEVGRFVVEDENGNKHDEFKFNLRLADFKKPTTYAEAKAEAERFRAEVIRTAVEREIKKTGWTE